MATKSLHADLIDYVKGCRVPMTRDEMAAELESLHRANQLAKVSPNPWPRATANEWKRAINQAIAANELIEIDGAVRLPPEEECKPEQMSLF